MKRAMILAAGMGTRLGEITADKPKILVDIGGVTLLEWITGKLVHYGFRDIIINVHHHADMIESAARLLGSRLDLKISFSDERSGLLDTGGGLYRARDFFGDEPFLLYNGDIVTDLDLNKLYETNINSGAIATLALRHRPGKRFFIVDGEGKLRGWTNRETGEKIMTGDSPGETDEIAFSAISVINPRIFNYMQEGVYSMRPVYLEVARDNLINSVIHDNGKWIDIGNPMQLEKCRTIIGEEGNHTILF